MSQCSETAATCTWCTKCKKIYFFYHCALHDVVCCRGCKRENRAALSLGLVQTQFVCDSQCLPPRVLFFVHIMQPAHALQSRLNENYKLLLKHHIVVALYMIRAAFHSCGCLCLLFQKATLCFDLSFSCCFCLDCVQGHFSIQTCSLVNKHRRCRAVLFISHRIFISLCLLSFSQSDEETRLWRF